MPDAGFCHILPCVKFLLVGHDKPEVRAMPGLSTHYLFGVGTLKYIKKLKLYEAVQNHPSVYALGQQGPDMLFYYPKFNGENIGSRMHKESTADFIYSMLHYIEKHLQNAREKEILLAYISGFLGHYVLDRIFHPYVYSYALKHNSILKQNSRHFKLETEVDAYLLKATKKIVPCFFKSSKTLALLPEEQNSVIGLLQYATMSVYGVMLTKRRLKITLFNMRLVHAFLRDKRGIKKRMLFSLECGIFGCPLISNLLQERTEPKNKKDLLNLMRKKWYNPYEKDVFSTKSVPDMLRDARYEYIGILQELDNVFAKLFEDKNKFIAYIGNYSYHTGKHI